MKRFIPVIIFVVFSLCNIWSIDKDCKRFAVIVGANDDMLTKNNGRRDFTGNDTKALKDVLENVCGYKTMVISGKTDKTKVMNILQDIACSQSLKSLIFYFSGYGFNYRKQPFLAFGDYDERHPVATALSYDELLYYFRMINDRTHVMAFIDYAFIDNGSDRNIFNTSDEEFVSIQRDRGIKVIMSGSPKTYIYKDYEEQRSIFSFFLTEGLRGEADSNSDGVVTFGEVSEYLIGNCRNYLVRNKYEKVFMPEIYSDSRDGDFNISPKRKNHSDSVEVTVSTDATGGFFTFNERFNEAYNSEFGGQNETKQKKVGLLSITRADFFDVKTFQPMGLFAKEDTGYVGLEILLRLSSLPDPHKRIILSIYFYYPDGSLMCKLDKPCRPLSTPGMMNCRVIYGWDNPGHWIPGKYTVKVAYHDEVLTVTNFGVR